MVFRPSLSDSKFPEVSRTLPWPGVLVPVRVPSMGKKKTQSFIKKLSLLLLFEAILSKKLMLAILVDVDPKGPFSIATTLRCRESATLFPGFLHFALDPYLIMLSVKIGGIKCHFLILWYDSTWDWTSVSRTIREYSTH